MYLKMLPRPVYLFVLLVLLTPPINIFNTVLFHAGIDAVKGAATGIEEYNPRSNKWTQITTMETRRLQFGVAIVNGKLYVTGMLF